MKRSQMLEFIKSFMIDGNYRNYTTTEADELLDMLEFQGMLPPEAADFNLGNTWEPEDEEK